MRIQGDLATYELSDLLQWLAQGSKTGTLIVSGGETEYQLGFDQGRIDMSSSSDPETHLDRYLLRKGLIDEPTLARANRLREATQMLSGQVLVTLGALSEEELERTLRLKTEEILCELLTWNEGSFEFVGGDRSESNQVPISLEVTKLLLESMHRLDQRQQERSGAAAPESTAEPAHQAGVEPVPEPAAEPPAVAPPAPLTTGTPSGGELPSEGLALAEVLDPSTASDDPPAGAPPAPASPEMPVHYAAMAQRSGPLQRLAPYLLVAVASLSGAGFYLVNRQADAGPTVPAGKPILFARLEPPPAAPRPATAEAPEATVAAPAAAERAQPVEDEQALRARYERQLAELRSELAKARSRSAEVAAAAPPEAELELPAAPPRPAPVTTRTTDPPVAKVPEPAAGQAEPTTPPVAAAALAAADETPARRPPARLPKPEPAVAAASSAPAEETAPATVPAALAVPELVRPALVDRPTPRYPVVAQRHHRGATVTVRLLIGAEGAVEQVERVGPKVGLGFDRAAEEAALRSSWRPGSRNGVAEPMWTELRFEFKP